MRSRPSSSRCLRAAILPLVGAAALSLSGAIVIVGCGGESSPTAPTSASAAAVSPPPAGAAQSPSAGTAPASETVFLAGAGDIADSAFSFSMENAARTAALIAALPSFTIVFTAGDNEQSDGSYQKFLSGFDKTWGRLPNRKLPTPGNHDFTPGYFQYFGSAADPDGTGGRGYYSVKLSSSWQFISLNSETDARSGSPQYGWLAQRLAEGAPCTMVVYHQPLQTNAENPPAGFMRDVWNLLYRQGAEIVVNGHNHVYERFPPKDDSLRANPLHGVRQFTVGTGGYRNYAFTRSEFPYDVRFTNVHGVISLTLEGGRYRWEFLSTTGTLDSGSDECHGPPPIRLAASR
jgi:hypothetical protein